MADTPQTPSALCSASRGGAGWEWGRRHCCSTYYKSTYHQMIWKLLFYGEIITHCCFNISLMVLIQMQGEGGGASVRAFQSHLTCLEMLGKIFLRSDVFTWYLMFLFCCNVEVLLCRGRAVENTVFAWHRVRNKHKASLREHSFFFFSPSVNWNLKPGLRSGSCPSGEEGSMGRKTWCLGLQAVVF